MGAGDISNKAISLVSKLRDGIQMSKVIDFFKDYELSNKIDGKLLFNQSLAKFSWLGVGGIAEVYYLCESFQQLEEILTSLPKECKRTVIGQG